MIFDTSHLLGATEKSLEGGGQGVGGLSVMEQRYQAGPERGGDTAERPGLPNRRVTEDLPILVLNSREATLGEGLRSCMNKPGNE